MRILIRPIRATSFLCGILLMVGCVTTPEKPVNAMTSSEIKLTEEDLYAGFDARKVLPNETGGLQLDKRVFKHGKKREGRVVTDPIALVPVVDGIAANAAVKALDVEVQAKVPAGADVSVEVRTGPTCFSEQGWSNWQKLAGLKGDAASPAGSYAQVRIILTADAVENLPEITALILRPNLKAGLTWNKVAKVVEGKIQKIVRSPIVFHYERQDHPALAKFRKTTELDKVVKGAKNDFEVLVKIQDWVAQSANIRHKDIKYRWDIEKTMPVTPGSVDKRFIQGHCMSYSQVMVDAASAMGFKARHTAILGFREMSHEVVEAWVSSLGKWVFFDPSLANYYYDLKTKEPLNVLGIHDIILEKFLRGKETLTWFSRHRSKSTRARVRAVGGKKHIGCRMGGWIYGRPMSSDYDWGFKHGWLAHGFVQMTPRNDFYTHPEAVSKHLSSYPGYSGYPFWVDARTPPRKGVDNWFTRKRDFYWTLDQASLTLAGTDKEGVLSVRLGQSMPFFKVYDLKVDGKAAKPAGDVFKWKLRSGRNVLEVVPLDEFGKCGSGSSVVVTY
ncbi:MAG: transglutaminase domain-containing protein [Kiritimatiellae bacterium]|nr:transglutaminase domain-containing protein [Kiritimatiellia bacterium]